jgi:triphosphoribosyl-dephospho-CoA synthase
VTPSPHQGLAELATPRPAPSEQTLARLYIDACTEELQAFKPGNVSVHAAGHDMTATDFVRSAHVSAPALCAAGMRLGERVLAAIRATRNEVGCNTNLGIVLLCAPLLSAAQHRSAGNASLATAVESVLSALTVRDAALVFEAIRTASPAGLGSTEQHDVERPATAGLREVMASAADRDRIARQYALGFPDVFGLGFELLNEADKRYEDRALRTVALYLGLLARVPDTHVQRKFGTEVAARVQHRAAVAEKALQRRHEVSQMLRAFDAELKDGGINPGTTADLTVATLLAARLR